MSAITTPFGLSSTAAEVTKGIDLTGRRSVVTGTPGPPPNTREPNSRVPVAQRVNGPRHPGRRGLR
jgi:hypothetical protein